MEGHLTLEDVNWDADQAPVADSTPVCMFTGSPQHGCLKDKGWLEHLLLKLSTCSPDIFWGGQVFLKKWLGSWPAAFSGTEGANRSSGSFICVLDSDIILAQLARYPMPSLWPFKNIFSPKSYNLTGVSCSSSNMFVGKYLSERKYEHIY